MALSEKIFFLRRLCLTSEKRVANMETEGGKKAHYSGIRARQILTRQIDFVSHRRVRAALSEKG